MKGRKGKSKTVSLACVRGLRQVSSATFYRETDPTPERLARAGFATASELGTRRSQVILGGRTTPIGADGIVRLNQAPLDRLFGRGQLGDKNEDANRQCYEAGCKLRNHHYLAGLSGFAANDLNGTGGGSPGSRTPITETMESNRRAMRLAESSMDAGDWRAVRLIVCEEAPLDAVGQEIGFGERHAAVAVALDRLRRGLRELASLWGFTPPGKTQSDKTPAVPVPANDAVAARAVA